MANSQFYQFLFSKNAALTMLQGQVDVGAAGALSNLQGSGIASMVRVSAGLYDITLEENYAKFLGINADLLNATSSGIAGTEIRSEQIADPTVPKIRITTLNAALAATDPASGSKIIFSILLRNSSVKGKGE